MIWIITILLSLLAFVFYRAGGMSKDDTAQPKFIPKWMRNTKARDAGLPVLMLLWFVLAGLFQWILIVCAGLMFAAQTSYFKKKETDAQWYNWMFVGLAFSVAMAPYVITGHWQGLIYRSILVTGFTVLWSQFISIDWLEEGGRGFIQIASLLLLTI